MTTNAEVITAALREINVIGETDTASPEQGAYCLGQLNDMLELWTENDISIGYFEQSSTADDCPIPSWAKMGVQAKLAEAIAGHYGATISVELQRKIDDGYATIRRKCMVENMKPASMSHMPLGSGQIGRGVDITD